MNSLVEITINAYLFKMIALLLSNIPFLNAVANLFGTEDFEMSLFSEELVNIFLKSMCFYRK